MEDRDCAVGAAGSEGSTALLLGVFDGHGGSQVAEFASRHLPAEILRRWQATEGLSATEVLFRDAFLQTDESARRSLGKAATVGSTACVALLASTPSRSGSSSHTLWVANTGDSRCVLRTRSEVVQMSSDHKPETARETARIVSSGGVVVNVAGVSRVMGNLSLSRSLGDWYMRPYVIPHPGVSKRQVKSGDRYILIASDGLWDVMSSREACGIVDALLPGPKDKAAGAGCTLIPRVLIAEARRRGSQDNITVLLGLL